MSRIFGWIGAAAVLAVAGASSAYALTTVEAPVTSNGARFASPDPDQQLEQRLDGQSGDSQRGFSIQVRPQPQENDSNSPFSRQRPMLPWLPGQPFPPR
jgi:hypothetical protein